MAACANGHDVAARYALYRYYLHATSTLPGHASRHATPPCRYPLPHSSGNARLEADGLPGQPLRCLMGIFDLMMRREAKTRAGRRSIYSMMAIYFHDAELPLLLAIASTMRCRRERHDYIS